MTAKMEFTGSATMGGGTKAGFEATFTIKRSEFGVSYGVENGALGNDVRVVVCLEGNAQK
jgi:polyisoprenoid-binding protein YceI